jgi:hypothetical protein
MVPKQRENDSDNKLLCFSDIFNYQPMQNNSYTVHTIKPTNALTLKLYFLPTISHNSDMFQSVLIILRELLNIIKVYIYIYIYIKKQIDYYIPSNFFKKCVWIL